MHIVGVPMRTLIIRALCFENFDCSMFASSAALVDGDYLMEDGGVQALNELDSASVQQGSCLPSTRAGA